MNSGVRIFFRLKVLCVCLSVVSIATTPVECFNVDPELARVVSGPSGSYFGFSVRILIADPTHTRVIVGAPLANSSLDTQLKTPGAVFDCDFDGKEQCEHQLDFGVDDRGNPVGFHDQLMGFSLDVAPGKPNRITACAPMWKNTRVNRAYLLMGQCYEIGYDVIKPSSLSLKYSPMKPGRGKYNTLTMDEVYMKGMGESGFSVHYTQDRQGNTALVTGAPGYFDWRGGIVYIDNSTKSGYKPSVLDDTFNSFGYNAYSLSSGVFFSDNHVYLVTGSPNYDHKGKVFVVNKSFSDIRLEHSGEQFGSYFGASVCAVDVNNDSYDDLIVGAPLYSSMVEEGKVYVYLSDGFNFLKQSTSILGPGVRYGRFGNSIEHTGDLNRDGFNDVVIGAPFVGGSGAIYFHQGSLLGLKTIPSQEILGKTIQPDLRGFGWAFSKAIDSDNNQYPDFAVGATFSDHIITFRTTPVATVEISLDISHDVVSAELMCSYKTRLVRCTEIIVSFKYTGVNCPSSLDIEYELHADTLADEEVELGRVQIQLQPDVFTPSLHRSLTLQRGRPVRIPYFIIVQSERDVFTDLGFDLSYKHTSECPLKKLCVQFTTKITQRNFIKRVQFLVRLDTNQLKPDHNSTTIYLKASSKSDELNSTLFDNFLAQSITLKSGSNVVVEGSSLPEQLWYRPQSSTNKDENRIVMTQRYTVSNTGIGPSPAITIHVSVPLKDTNGKQLFHLTSFEIVSQYGQKTDIDGECRHPADSANQRSMHTLGRQSASAEILITCENFDCTTVSCRLSGLKAGSAALVNINGWIQESGFASFKTEGVIKFQSDATVTLDDHPLLDHDTFRSGHFSVRTDLYGHIISPASISSRPTVVAVVVAIVVAVLILLTVCGILWKVGFFRRKKKEDMKNLSQDENSEHSKTRSKNTPDPVASSDPVTSFDLDIVPPVAPCVASCDADDMVPVTKTASTQDDYLHAPFVAMLPDDNTENEYEYVDFDKMKAH